MLMPPCTASRWPSSEEPMPNGITGTLYWLASLTASETSCVLSANTTAAGGGASNDDSSRPCCSRTTRAVEQLPAKRAFSASISAAGTSRWLISGTRWDRAVGAFMLVSVRACKFTPGFRDRVPAGCGAYLDTRSNSSGDSMLAEHLGGFRRWSGGGGIRLGGSRADRELGRRQSAAGGQRGEQHEAAAVEGKAADSFDMHRMGPEVEGSRIASRPALRGQHICLLLRQSHPQARRYGNRGFGPVRHNGRLDSDAQRGFPWASA